MSSMFKLCILVLLVITSILFTIFIVPRIKVYSVANSRNNTDSKPCWFLSSKGFDSVSAETIQNRQNREMYGYPQDIKLSEALSIYNEEQNCFGRTNKPLTETEIIAVLRTDPDYGSEKIWKDRKEVLSEIFSNHTLPKGSLLIRDVTSSLEEEEDYLVASESGNKLERIYLVLDLHKHPRLEGVDASQRILIRKFFLD